MDIEPAVQISVDAYDLGSRWRVGRYHLGTSHMSAPPLFRVKLRAVPGGISCFVIMTVGLDSGIGKTMPARLPFRTAATEEAMINA